MGRRPGNGRLGQSGGSPSGPRRPGPSHVASTQTSSRQIGSDERARRLHARGSRTGVVSAVHTRRERGAHAEARDAPPGADSAKRPEASGPGLRPKGRKTAKNRIRARPPGTRVFAGFWGRSARLGKETRW